MRTQLLVCAGVLAVASPALADDVLHPGAPQLDPPTLTALGVVLPITGDDNFSASVAVRYRVMGTTAWHEALPLFHVHAEAVMDFTVTPQFAGEIFDLAPDTAYEIELHATDFDGSIDTTLAITGRTRPVPISDPVAPRVVSVDTFATLTSALASAQPGDVITLANGVYNGTFSFTGTGSATNPIVIRGQSEDGVILDGGGCTGCNVLEAYGDYIHVENLTIQNASRAIRFQTAGTHDNVVRRVHIRDVTLGIGSTADQHDFYIADNILEGRLAWPCVYTSDDTACNAGAVHGLHANDDGINVQGTGHVVAHNRLSGFGDAMKTEQDGARSIDFYGNDVTSAYDNGIELDGSARNTRAMRNRFTNTFATLSFQPIFGGPAYAIRNVLFNVADEQFKLHSRGTTPTVGAVIMHNTVIRSTRAVQCSTNISPLYFLVANNLFLGPTTLDPDLHTVRWDVPTVSSAIIDYNGYYPDGQFQYGYTAGSGGVTYATFAAAMAGGKFDAYGTLVDQGTVTGNLVGPAAWQTAQAPVTPSLAPASIAIDRGVKLANLDDIRGAAPDLGALEDGCDPPIYGPRPAGMDETNEPLGCPTTGGIADDVPPDGGTTGGGTKAGGCCEASPPAGNLVPFLMVVLGLVRRRRTSHRG